MTKKMKGLIIAGVLAVTLAIAGASVLGVDEFLKLFDGVTEVIMDKEVN
jgi:hypothetical protein